MKNSIKREQSQTGLNSAERENFGLTGNKILSKQTIQREVTVDGMMVFGQTEDGLRTADFECCEDVHLEAFIAKCKVQIMRDGNVYITELPKRVRNQAIFREDNSSLSHGQDGKYYFYFSIDESRLGELPEQLVRQASAIAQKVIKSLAVRV
jgi:hypothetical protein